MQASANPNFTERTRIVLDIARSVAAQSGNDALAPEHLFVGMLREGDGVGVSAMRLHGIDRKQVMEETMRHLPARGPRTQACDIGYDARALKVLDGAIAVARELDHPYVGTDHLLLSLLRDTAGQTAQILGRHGFGFDVAKARILWMLAGDPLAPLDLPPAV